MADGNTLSLPLLKLENKHLAIKRDRKCENPGLLTRYGYDGGKNEMESVHSAEPRNAAKQISK